MNNNLKDIGFKGDVVLIYLNQSNESFAGGLPIKNPKIENIHGELFLTGVVPEEYDWSGGLRMGAKFDQIAHFIEFETEEKFFKKLTSSTEKVGNA